MILIYLTSGDCTEIEAAVRARVEDGHLLCFDQRGVVVGTFPAASVQTYTANEVLAEAIEDEACEEVAKIPSPEDPRQAVYEA